MNIHKNLVQFLIIKYTINQFNSFYSCYNLCFITEICRANFYVVTKDVFYIVYIFRVFIAAVKCENYRAKENYQYITIVNMSKCLNNTTVLLNTDR